MGAHFKSIIGAGADNPVVHIETTDGAFDQPTLKITQDGSGDAVTIVNGGNSNSINIDHNGTASAVYIDAAQSKPSIVASDGAAGYPAYSFRGEDNTGMFRDGGSNVAFSVTGSKKMIINSDGTIGAPSGSNIYNPSDSRLKQNVSSLSGCLAKIKQLKGVSFNWIDGFAVDEKDKTLYGLVAQDAQTVDPNLIEDYGNGLLSIEGVTIDNPLRVNEKFIIPMLIEAMKELSAKVTALENA